jgi:hypothetical protein
MKKKKENNRLITIAIIILVIIIVNNNKTELQQPTPQEQNQQIINSQEREATISEPDFRNLYGISWRGTACENINYAKSMGYDYVSYQEGMQNCPNNNDLKFYILDPDMSWSLPVYEICPSKTYTSTQIQTYNDYFLWKSKDTFPTNLATGWFFGDGCFRPLPDFQQQKIIDDDIQRTISKLANRENKANNFLFGGWAWDVPSLEGDIWNGIQSNGGYQIDIDDWTGNCSGIKHPGATYEYSCYTDARAEYFKKLFVETKKTYPEMKVVMEPFNIYNDWIKEVSSRTDAQQLMPDFMLQEGRTLGFVTDNRIFTLGLTRADTGYTAPDITTNHDKQFLNFSGYAAINGEWSIFFGRFGTGNYAYSSITLVPAREKMVKAFPVWDNINGVLLADRSWDKTNLIYQSTNSYASTSAIYSRHPKNGNIYAVIIDSNGKIILKNDERVKEIYSTDQLMQRSSISTNDFNINGQELTLKDSSNYGKAYIIITQTTQIACTMEAKLCPDGSSVGRVGPNCEFAACPSANTCTGTATSNNCSGTCQGCVGGKCIPLTGCGGDEHGCLISAGQTWCAIKDKCIGPSDTCTSTNDEPRTTPSPLEDKTLWIIGGVVLVLIYLSTRKRK